MKTHPTRGRAWAYAGAILGGAVSVAANVAHSFIPPHGASDSWSPEPGAVVGAIVWPVFLFIAVEILARTVWPAGKAWTVLRFGGLLPVAAVAAFVSYRHLSGLLAHYGEEPIVYLLGPIAVDGLMLMATGALLAINHRTHPAATTATPVTSAAVTPAPIPAQPTPPPAVTPAPASVPAPVPVVVPASVSVVDTPPVPVSAPAVVPPVVHTSPSGSVPAVAVSRPLVTVDEPANPTPALRRPAQAPAPSRTDTPVAASGVASPAVLPVSAALLTRATHLANAHLATTGTPITAGELAVKLRVGTAVASQVLAVLNLRTDSPTTPTSRLNGSTVQVSR